DQAMFDLDGLTGELTFKAAPNFEAPGDSDGDNAYEIQVQVSDGVLTDTQTVAITVTNVNEAPLLTSASTFDMVENQTAAATIMAEDPDAGATLGYAIIGGADAGLFDLDSVTGELTFKAAPDYELPGDADGDNAYEVQVEVSDGALTDTRTVTITVTNANESPFLTIASSIEAAENQTAIATITADEPDTEANLTYSIVGGADAALFDL